MIILCHFRVLTEMKWMTESYMVFIQHDANAVSCDTGLSSQLKSAAYTAMTRMAGEVSDDVPVLMSGAGHDAMAMSHLTKVCSFPHHMLAPGAA